MTSGSISFNTFLENQLTTFRAVQAVLWNSTLPSEFFWQKCRYCLKLFSEVPVRSTGAYRHTLSPDRYDNECDVLKMLSCYDRCNQDYSLPPRCWLGLDHVSEPGPEQNDSSWEDVMCCERKPSSTDSKKLSTFCIIRCINSIRSPVNLRKVEITHHQYVFTT